ncbi:hypothetical protein [Kineosporia sp. R_H_3]|uniref:hypothetical protein n=1 Tax=Kineosporia sp. R_H_3 TaxID=1961848 RepID=UPI000B4BF00D|nr:hypothetical protein [Kineosporia sp. R_H_3]
MATDEFAAVRAEHDPLVQARLATELIGTYQQRSVELARLRRVAIERAASERAITMSAVAAEIGLTKGRITQIRQSAPPAERALFGVGPVAVALPLQEMPGQSLAVVSAEDDRAGEKMTDLLTSFGFQTSQYRIPIGGDWTPSGDVVAICGPKSSRVTAEAIDADPVLSFEPDSTDRWIIAERAGGRIFESGMDRTPSKQSDVAYVGRLPYGDGTLLVVAGVHAIGSLGAIHYLAGHAAEIYSAVGDACWSAVVESTHTADGAITSSGLAFPSQRHA